MVNKDRLAYLVRRAIEKSASPDELVEISNLLQNDDSEAVAAIELLLKDYATERVALTPIEIEEMAGAVLLADHAAGRQPGKVIGIKPVWKRLLVAASVIIVLGLGIAAFLGVFNSKPNQDMANTKIPQDVKAPQTNRASITLANGSILYLDSAGNGMLAQQGNVKLIKLANGQIGYETAPGTVMAEMQYNTLSNPRGSKVIDMKLTDGSHVWLNAGSSVTYPVSFVGNERRVTITGEAYFEVVHNAAKPFFVSIEDMQVQVLGTHFNINGYDDEPTTKTTLLEGRVKVTKNEKQVILNPGQQALVQSGQDDLRIAYDVDVDEAVAWKNGKFLFNATDLETVLRQVARWYDVDLIYMKKIKGKISANIQRTGNILPLLRILEETGELKFKINGRKIIVTPK